MGHRTRGPLTLPTSLPALASALCWGIGDFSGGISSRLGSVTTTLAAGQLVGLVATALVLLYAGEPYPPAAALAWAAVAGGCGVGGLGCFYLALSRGTMGLVAPLAALVGAAIPALVGLVAGEPAGPLLIMGIVAALAAVVLISLPDGPAVANHRSPRQGRRATELGLVLAAGLGFATFFLAIDQSRLAGGETWWPILVVRLAGIAVISAFLVVLTTAGRRPSLRAPLAVVPLIVLAGLGDLGGNLFFIVADASGDLPVAVVLSSLYPVVTAVLARVFLGERLARIRIAGVLLAMVAVALIAVARA